MSYFVSDKFGRYLHIGLLSIALLAAAGCDFDSSPGAQDTQGGEAWSLGGDTGEPSDDTGSEPVDSGPTDEDTDGPAPDTSAPAPDTSDPPVDSNLLPDTSRPDDTGSDTSPPDDGGQPNRCQSNSECSGSEICCPDRQGGQIVGTCKAKSDCSIGDGGFCKQDAECGQGETCCDVPMRSQKLCVGKDLCQSGGSGQSCDTNPDCPQGEKCCPNVQGNGECQPNCTGNGGFCSADSECEQSESCCDVLGQKVCSEFC